MRKIVLISCVSKKLPDRARARDIYVSPLFRLGLKYAYSLNPDDIFILSAKFGLLDLEQEIEPYELTLNKMTEAQVREWATNVKSQLEKKIDLWSDEVIFLAGERYRKYLIPHLKNYQVPMKGLGIGKQLRYLKQHTSR